MQRRNCPFFESLEARRLLSATLIISKGGTYTGTWESDNPSVATIIVRTSQPVIIQNATIRGKGDLIDSDIDHTNITVRNCTVYGLNPNVAGRAQGRFIDDEQPDNLLVQGNHINGTGGIYVLGYLGNHTSADTVRVLNNTAHNIDGRESDGKSGYLTFNTRTSLKDGHSEDGFVYAQFVQLDQVQHVGGIQIGYNQITNDPGQSRVEDNISIYKSSGTSASPIKIYNNDINGAYTIAPWQGDTKDASWSYDWSFSGGGIMLGDGVGDNTSQDPGYVQAYNNVVLNTTNYGIAMSAGHNLSAYNNTILSTGKLADGRTIVDQNTGLYVWDSYAAGSSHFYANVVHNNTIGWMQGSSRNDWWMPDAASCYGDVHYTGSMSISAVNSAVATLLKSIL